MASNLKIKKLYRDMEEFWFDEKSEDTLDIYGDMHHTGTTDNLKI